MNIQSVTAKEGLARSVVTALAECPDEVIWIGTQGGGLARYDGQAVQLFTRESGLPSNIIQALCRDKQGNLWIGTADQGLCRYNGRFFHSYTTADGLPANDILCLYEDHEDVLWIGTRGGGLSRFDGETFLNYTTEVGLAHRRDVSGIQEDSTGVLWIATPGGVSRFDGEQFHNYRNTNGLPDNWVNSIYVDHDDVVWVLTAMGICHIVDGKVTPIDPELLSIEHPYFVIQDGTTYYLGSGKGVHKYDRTEGLIGRLDQSNGLASNQCSFNAVFKDSRNHFWFGTGGGATRFLPNPATLAMTPAPVYITGMTVNGESIASVTELSLPHQSNKMALDFNTLWYQEPENVLYSYRLLGLDDTWFEQRTRSVEYSYLPPGAYTFQVTARNTNGLWNSQPAALSFVIHPPVWKTWWFSLVSTGVLMLLLISAHRIRTNMYRQRARALESAVKSRTSELLHKTDELTHAKSLLEDAHNNLEIIVTKRTEELRQTINQLNSEVLERMQAERRLQSLASQLTLVEERQRRAHHA